MRRLLTARNLNEAWLLAPQLLIFLLQQLFGITEERMHSELCESFGCRCSS